jgi:predicted ATP-grasp superfamily ATP-dependent carboligase
VRIFIYEFITGGGCFQLGHDRPPTSLLREGAAMVRALLEDFALLPAVQLDTLYDHRLGRLESAPAEVHPVRTGREERARFSELAAASDGTIVIAPEFDGLLLQRCQWVLAAGGHLLGPGLETVSLAADKNAMARHLEAAQVPVPASRCVRGAAPLPADFTYPAVLKPTDGAGSLHLAWVAGPTGAVGGPVRLGPMRLERYCPGVHVSVSFLAGSAGTFPMIPCRQRLSGDGRFAYQGGEILVDAATSDRARQLATAAAATLPDPLGYFGIDLVLGPDPEGSEDVVIEVNPRMTTSYIGLRAAACGNLADWMVQIASGKRPEMVFRPQRIQFHADGRVIPPDRRGDTGEVVSPSARKVP